MPHAPGTTQRGLCPNADVNSFSWISSENATDVSTRGGAGAADERAVVVDRLTSGAGALGHCRGVVGVKGVTKGGGCVRGMSPETFLRSPEADYYYP